MRKYLKKNIQRLIKKKITKKIRGKKKNSTYDHNRYYQNLYQNYLTSTAKDEVENRNNLRDEQIEQIKHKIGKLNEAKKDENNSEIKKLSLMQEMLERDRIKDQQYVSDLKIGNNLANPIATNQRELDDQHLFGSMMYQSMNRPNYFDYAKKLAQAREEVSKFDASGADSKKGFKDKVMKKLNNMLTDDV